MVDPCCRVLKLLHPCKGRPVATRCFSAHDFRAHPHEIALPNQAWREGAPPNRPFEHGVSKACFTLVDAIKGASALNTNSSVAAVIGCERGFAHGAPE